MSESYEKFIYRRSWTASVYIATTIDCGSVAVARTRSSAFVPANETVSIEFNSEQFALENNASKSFTSFVPDFNGKMKKNNDPVALSQRVTTWKVACECPIEVVKIDYYGNDGQSKNDNQVPIFSPGSFSFLLPKGSVMGTLILPLNSRIVFFVRRDRAWSQNEK